MTAPDRAAIRSAYAEYARLMDAHEADPEDEVTASAYVDAFVRVLELVHAHGWREVIAAAREVEPAAHGGCAYD